MIPPQNDVGLAFVLPPIEGHPGWIPVLAAEWHPGKEGKRGHGSIAVWLVTKKKYKDLDNRSFARLLRFELDSDGTHSFPHHSFSGAGAPYGDIFHLGVKELAAGFVRVPLASVCRHPQALLATSLMSVYGAQGAHAECFRADCADETGDAFRLLAPAGEALA